MPLRVFHERRRVVEAHRPRVQDRGVEGGRVVRLQIRARVRDQRERRRVRFGEPVERERRDGFHDLLLRRGVDSPLGHAAPQLLLDRSHPLLRALEPHRAPQFLRLAAREARGDHRDLEQLLLEERDAEGALQDRLEGRVRVLDGRHAAPPIEERMHHAADDRTRPDDRDLHDDVVEDFRRVARE